MIVDRRDLVRLAGLGAAAATATHLQATESSKGKPNIIFNLADDVGEKKDLAGNLPEKAAELKEALAKWRKQTGAVIPANCRGYDPKRLRAVSSSV